MVDSNLQRPNILPSEKAFAYRMKMEAMNHQGTSGGISAKDIGKNANDSARQVYRYIRLTYLMNDLLNAVDRDVIGLQVGVELSYLTVPEQEMVEEVHESTGKYPSLEQAKKIRQHREEKTLTKEIVRLLVIGERKKKTTVTFAFHSLKIMECCSYTHDTSLPSYLSMILIAPFLQKLTYNSPYLLFIILWRKILLNFILF